MEEPREHPAVAAGTEDAGRDEQLHWRDVSPTEPIETDVASLHRAFDRGGALTIGIEEELLLLDLHDLDLAPVAAAVVEAAAAPGRVKSELPAAQVETVTAPAASVAEAAAQMADGRRLVARASAGVAVPAAVGTHPFADPVGAVAAERRDRDVVVEYGEVARLQLVSGLHIHVHVGGAERALAVYNALRSHLPELAALAANAPFVAGRDSGMASVRPKISELLPRQGVPPRLASWAEYSQAIGWGARSGSFEHPRLWWWELRPHPRFGTVELRVPDQQTTVADSAAVAAVAHALVGWLAERHDAGERLPVHPSWKIEQNRWSAARHGVRGSLADLASGERRPARERLRALLEALEPVAERLGCAGELERAGELVGANGADRLRAAADGDPRRAAAWAAERFLDGT